MNFPAPNQDVIARWLNIAKFLGIPEEAYNPEVRVIRDTSGKSNYLFGAILNENRSLRPLDSLKNKMDCPLCGAVEDTKEEPGRRLDADSELKGYVVVPNIFPAKLGHSMAVTEGTRELEEPMYTTQNLDYVAEEMRKVFAYCTKVGFQAFHNGKGSGASVPNHEHWHLTNWHATFSTAGQIYGFESAETEEAGICSVRKMPEFPFAHLIFHQDEPDRIIKFLKDLQDEIGRRYKEGEVPHIVCQGLLGILVAPFKNYLGKGSIGSGDVAGHIVFKNRTEFEQADYGFCANKLNKQLFKSGEIDLTKFL